jgi:hypothetical protein
MKYIREVSFESDLEESLWTIKVSFLTVVKDLNLTEKDNPSNPAFTSINKLKEMKVK